MLTYFLYYTIIYIQGSLCHTHFSPYIYYIACVFHFCVSECSVEIISCIDPASGLPTQKIVKTIKDPETGQVYKMVTPLPADQQNNVQIVCKTDPVTGKVTQQVVQTITNTETGETTQLPVETSTGTFTNLIPKQCYQKKPLT